MRNFSKINGVEKTRGAPIGAPQGFPSSKKTILLRGKSRDAREGLALEELERSAAAG